MTTLNYENDDLFYRTSGAAPPMSTTLGAAGAWLAVSIVAAIYAYADLYIKVAEKVSVLVTVAFVVAMGFTVAGVLKVARVRNYAVTALIACTSAILALYVCWVVWEQALIDRFSAESGDVAPSFMFMFSRPKVVWDFAMELSTEGTFTRGEEAVKGTELLIFWGLEALGILGCVTAIPILMLRQRTFCEACNRWMPKAEPIMRVAPSDEETIRQQMIAKNLPHLTTLGWATSQTPHHLLVELRKCPGCDESSFVSVNRITITVNNKGQRNEKVKKIVDRMRLTPEEVATLRELASPPPAPDAPPTGGQTTG